MALTAAEVYRDFVTDGVPSSEWHQPKKSEIRALLTRYEQIINAFLSNGGVIYSSLSALNDDLTKAANTMAWVAEDATAANNGVYRKIGASGSGSWTRVADLPYSFIVATDVGAGTPNAIQATSALPISSSALVLLNVYEANTGSPVTVSFNGGSSLTIKTNSGNDVSPGGLQSGMLVVGRVSGSIFRLVSDQVAAAIIAQAEALVQEAKDARNAAVAAAGSVQRTEFATVALAEASQPDAIPAFVRVAGLMSPDDGGGGLYGDPAEAEPAIGPKIFIPHVNRWFTGTETVMDIMRFGARRLGAGSTAVAANNAAFADAKEWLHGRLIAGALPELQFGPGVYDYDDFPNFAKNRARVIGQGEVKLRFHGSGPALVLDGQAQTTTPPYSDGVWEMKFKGFQVEAPQSAFGDGIVIKAIHESDFDLECRGARLAGLRLHWLVSSRIRYRCAGNGFGWYDNNIADYAIFIDDHDTPLDFNDDGQEDYTATSFTRIHFDTTGTVYGIWAAQSNGNMLMGTAQAHQQTGILLAGPCQDNVIFNSDFEVNAVYDIHIQGKGNTVRDSVTLKSVQIDLDARGNRIEGGVHSKITLGPATTGNVISTKLVARSGDGTISDSGFGNVIAGTWDDVNTRVWKRPKQTLTVTPSGTLYAYQNPYGDPLVISITGGTVASISINAEQVGGATGGQFLLPPGAVAQWDATVAPTVKVWGL
nr:right-handed parallel beta-helix repeat-containing protein [Rhizobium sp. Q54]